MDGFNPGLVAREVVVELELELELEAAVAGALRRAALGRTGASGSRTSIMGWIRLELSDRRAAFFCGITTRF